jgi:hypothetical protein
MDADVEQQEFIQRVKAFSLSFNWKTVELLYDENGLLRDIRDGYTLFFHCLKKEFELPSDPIESGKKVKAVWNSLEDTSNDEATYEQMKWNKAAGRYKQLFNEATKDLGLIFFHKLMFY